LTHHRKQSHWTLSSVFLVVDEGRDPRTSWCRDRERRACITAKGSLSGQSRIRENGRNPAAGICEELRPRNVRTGLRARSVSHRGANFSLAGLMTSLCGGRVKTCPCRTRDRWTRRSARLIKQILKEPRSYDVCRVARAIIDWFFSFSVEPKKNGISKTKPRILHPYGTADLRTCKARRLKST